MESGVKIAIGAGATALFAWAFHGPMGQGGAFLAALESDAQLALAVNGLPDVDVAFSDRPLTRVAYLSGATGTVASSDVVTLLAGLPGSAGAVWRDGEAKPLPETGEGAVPATGSGAGVTPALRSGPVSKPIGSPAVASATAPAMMAVTASGELGGCQRGVNDAINKRVMIFQPGSAWLNATSLAIIRDVAKALARCDGYRLDIAGHSDNVGDEGINRLMSEERAKRVRDALIGKGVTETALSAKGYGSTRPILTGQANDPANRRVTFVISGAGD